MIKNYAIFIAPTGTGYSALAPDLPDCAAAGKTRDETLDGCGRLSNCISARCAKTGTRSRNPQLWSFWALQ